MKPWTAEEEWILEECWEECKGDLLEALPGRNWKSIKAKGRRMGLRPRQDIHREYLALTSDGTYKHRKTGSKRRAWKPVDVEVVRRHYPDYRAIRQELSEPRCTNSIYEKAKQLGLPQQYGCKRGWSNSLRMRETVRANLKNLQQLPVRRTVSGPAWQSQSCGVSQ